MDTPYVSPDTDYNNFADDDEYTGSPLKRFLKGAGAPSPNPSVAPDPSLLPASAKTSGPMLVPTGVAPNGRMNVGPDTSTATKDSPTATTVANMAGNQPVQPPDGIGQRLSKLHGPPTPPQMNPDYPKVNDDLRQAETPLNRTDPKYKMGVGGRIGGAILNLMSGGIPGAIRGAIDPSTPGFYGKGAVNSQFTRDEMARQSRVAGDQAKVKSYDDEYSQAEKGYGHDITAYNDEARAAGKADSDEIRNKYQSDLNTERTAHNTTEENLRGENNDLKAQPKTYEQYVGALEKETDPGKKAILQRVVDRLEKQKTAGKGPKLSAKDQLKLDSYMQDNKIDDVGDMTNADIKKALAASDGPAHVKDRQTFEDHWKKDFDSVESKYDKQRQAILKSYGADKDPSQYGKNKQEVDSKFADIEAKREAEKSSLQTEKDKEAEQYQVYGKPAKQQPATPSAAPATDGTGMAVPATTDSKGQPLAAIPAPIASVRTAPTPATASPAPTPNATPSPTPSKAKPSPATAQTSQPQLTPIKDTQVTSPGGKTYKVGQNVNGKTIKGFARDQNGKVHATF